MCWIEATFSRCEDCNRKFSDILLEDGEVVLIARAGTIRDIKDGHTSGLDDFDSICMSCRNKRCTNTKEDQ